MVSHWIFFLCYTCFGKVPSIVSKRLTTHDCGTDCHTWRGKEGEESTMEANQEQWIKLSHVISASEKL